jgi:hypothetical protein
VVVPGQVRALVREQSAPFARVEPLQQRPCDHDPAPTRAQGVGVRVLGVEDHEPSGLPADPGAVRAGAQRGSHLLPHGQRV